MKSWSPLVVTIAVIIMLLVVSCGNQQQPPPAAQNALEALQAVNYKIGVGMSYTEYRKLLAETAIPVETYLDSKDAEDSPKLARELEDVWLHYLSALKVWEMEERYGDFFWPEDEKLENIITFVPLVETIDFKVKETIKMDYIVQRLWQASEPKLTSLVESTD